MSENKHQHHHHFHHHDKEDESQNAAPEATPYEKAVKKEKHDKRMEHLGELGTVAAGTFALYEKHQAKKDPENAHKHKIAEEIAATAAVGAGGYVFHEHHKKKESHKEVKHHNF